MTTKIPGAIAAAFVLAAQTGRAVAPVPALAPVPCGAGSYASRPPLSLAKSTLHGGDQSRFMQTRPLFLSPRMAAAAQKGEPLPTNDWWTHALVSQWTGNLWSYPAKVRIDERGVRVAFPSYWIDNGTELKERTAVVVSAIVADSSATGGFSPAATEVDGWHDFDVEFVQRDGDKSVAVTLAHGSPFVWVEFHGVAPAFSADGGELEFLEERDGGRIARVGGDFYGIWTDSASYAVVGLLPGREAFDALAPFAHAVIRSTRVEWRYDAPNARLGTAWVAEARDIRGGDAPATPLQGFLPHHLRRASHNLPPAPGGLSWLTPHGVLTPAPGSRLEISYPFDGMVPFWPVPQAGRPGAAAPFDPALFKELVTDYARRGTFGGDTYWGGKGLIQMAFAMMAARETGDAATFAAARDRLRETFEDWLVWSPGEGNRYFHYVPRWGGLVGISTSYDSDTFNDHHFHYGYFTYAGALLCAVDQDFAAKFGPMLKLIAKDYANWDRSDKRFPFLRTMDPWAGHSFAGGMGDGNGNGQESSSEAMQGWGGLLMLALALGDDEMRDAAVFGYVSESRAVAEYWFDRDRRNIDYSKYRHPYCCNFTCHGVGWWTFFSGDPAWMHSIQWLPDTPALDYLSEDLAFAKWDWETMWRTKEIGGWTEKGRDAAGNETPPVGDASLGNVFLSYLRRHDPQQAAEIFAMLRERRLGAAMNADTAHKTYWAIHSQLDFGAPDFSVRASVPSARAFVRDGVRTFAAYNFSDKPQKVRFLDGEGKVVATLDAAPRAMTVSRGGAVSSSPQVALPAFAPAAPKVSVGTPVADEEIALAAMSFAAPKAELAVGGSLKLELAGENQFGEPMEPRDVAFAVFIDRERDVGDFSADDSDDDMPGISLGLDEGDDFSTGTPRDEPASKKSYSIEGGFFKALAPGKYLIRASCGAVSADCRVSCRR